MFCYQRIVLIFLLAFSCVTSIIYSDVKAVQRQLHSLQKRLVSLKNKLIDITKRLKTLQQVITSRDKVNREESVIALQDITKDVRYTRTNAHDGKVFTVLDLRQSKLRSDKNTGLMNLVPSIGYYSEGYPMREHLLLLELSSKILEAHMPTTMSSVMSSVVMPYTTKVFCVAFHGGLQAHPTENNLLFHGFLAYCTPEAFYRYPGGEWYKKKSNNQRLLMGVFDAKNVEANVRVGMPFSKIEQVNVHHHDDAFSPNNAKILFRDNAVATFWTAVISPDKAYVAVTYNIVLHNKEQTEQVKGIIKQTTCLKDLLNKLQEINPALDIRHFFSTAWTR